jgi:hypothetical protein
MRPVNFVPIRIKYDQILDKHHKNFTERWDAFSQEEKNKRLKFWHLLQHGIVEKQ